MVVFSAEFFNEKVRFYRVSTIDGTLVASRDIDCTLIQNAESVTYVDINNDGIKELLVNNHEKSNTENGIWAYHFPSDWMTGEFTRSTIATGFKNKFSLTVPNMAPGFTYPFWPNINQQGKEPAHIVVAGDGDHTAHLLTPTDPSTFAYELDTIKEMNGTVGALAWGDLDSDGWNELFVPDYDSSLVEVFAFSALENKEFL